MCDKSMKECMGMCYAVLSHSVVSDSATLWTVARQAPLSMGFCRQKYWSGLSCPSPGDLPDPEIEPTSLTSSELAGIFFTTSAMWEAPNWFYKTNISSVVMYGCESCTKKKAEHRRIDGF